MILLEIKKYLQEQKRASLRDIAVKFDLTESAVKEMLAHWERKGKIIRAEKKQSCGKECSCCSSSCAKVYFWKES